MKLRCLFCLLLALCLTAAAACGEGMTVVSFFPAASYFHVACDIPDHPLAFDAAFYTDGSIHGVTDDHEETCGYYALMQDGSMFLDVGSASFQLDGGKDGSYAGNWPDIHVACTLTPIDGKAFEAAAAQADVYLDAKLDRIDIPLWDYPVYARITAAEGLDLLLNPAWPEFITGHLSEGTLVRILGPRYDDPADYDDYLLVYDEDQLAYDVFLLEADGVRGFALSKSLEEIPARYAKVVRSSKKDKGRTVNFRSTPDFGDNVIQEVPYGKIVDVLPFTDGEFTRVYYDYREGWMTTVRLEIIDD